MGQWNSDYAERTAATIQDDDVVLLQDKNGAANYNAKIVNIIGSKNKSWLKANGFNFTDDLILPHAVLPNNYAILDKNGNYHWMVEIPRKNWDVANTFAGATIHPAFMVNGVQKRIFIGKYQVSQNSASQYVTHAGKAVKHSLSFDEFLSAINALNGSGITGFHMMTNAEWALIGLLCKYYNQMPYGNNNYGRDIDDKAITGQFEAGSTAVFGSSSGNGARWLAGSGGVLTSHNRQADGIFDLNGNVWEWVGGLRLNEGEIQILENNNAADYTKDQGASSTEWKAILADGTLVAPGTANTLKLDSSSPGSVVETIVNQDVDPDYQNNTFESQTTALSGAGIDLLKKLAVHPYTTGLGSDQIYFRNYGERLPVRGGSWSVGTAAGVFSLYLNNLRSLVYSNLGSRVAFVM